MAAKDGNSRRVLTIGISGSSCTGKSTLCALLEVTLKSNLFIHDTQLLAVHCDAFCKDFGDLPRTQDGSLDADGRDSVDFKRLCECINYVQQTGELPSSYMTPDFILDDLSRARNALSEKLLQKLSVGLDRLLQRWMPYDTVLLVDGFLLYHDESLRHSMDTKLLLRAERSLVRERRFGRYGENAASEGSSEFWKTESYFENIVWPNFVSEHGFLFPKGDVEAPIDSALVFETFKIFIQPETNDSLEKSLQWAVDALGLGPITK